MVVGWTMAKIKSCSHTNVLLELHDQVMHQTGFRANQSYEYESIRKLFGLIKGFYRSNKTAISKNLEVPINLEQFSMPFCRDCCESPIEIIDKTAMKSRFVYFMEGFGIFTTNVNFGFFRELLKTSCDKF